MKRYIGIWQLFGFAVTSLLGTVLHFLYDWLGRPIWIAPFSGVNESTWEHMKLLFWPMVLFAVIQRFFLDGQENFWCIKLRGILLGLMLIPIIFYTYNGVIGPSPDWINISIFFFAAAIAYAYEYRLFRHGAVACKSPASAIIVLVAIALMFVLFTFNPPKLSIFIDPTASFFENLP